MSTENQIIDGEFCNFNSVGERILIEPQMDMIFNPDKTPGKIGFWLNLFNFQRHRRALNVFRINTCTTFYGWNCISPDCKYKVTIRCGKKSNFCWYISSNINKKTQEFETYFTHTNCLTVALPTVKIMKNLDMGSMLTTGMKPKDIVDNLVDVGHVIGFKELDTSDVNYNNTSAGYFKARRFNLAITHSKIDPFEDGFSYLPAFNAVLLEQNPGSCINLQTETVIDTNGMETQQFVRLFLMLKQQAVCASYCKPVMSLDGGFMKVNYY